VKAAFVVGLPDAGRGELVGCLVCVEPDEDLNGESLRAQLHDQLSSYKIPKRIVVLPYEDAPWLPSGKISKPRVEELLSKGTDKRSPAGGPGRGQRAEGD
jgi:acyl-CoA synthetase (AMP-forming)/AMP-acid ligase II